MSVICSVLQLAPPQSYSEHRFSLFPGYLGQLYSLIQRHVPIEPILKLETRPAHFPKYWAADPNYWAPQRDAADLSAETVDGLLRSLAGDVMFRKYSVDNVTRALEAVLKQGSTVSQASVMFGIKRSTLQFYLKKLNIVLKKSAS